MKYSDLIEKGSSPTEIQRYLAEGEQVAITIRIPKNLRDAGKEGAELKGMSFSALLRVALINELARKDA